MEVSKKIIKINNNDKYLLYYNLIFFYHSEPIELLDYYINNINKIFEEIKSNDMYEIIFDIIFFVSDIDKFICNLQIFKEITLLNNEIDEIYENNINTIKLKSKKIKIKNCNFFIEIKEIMSFPNIFVKNYFDTIKHNYEIDYGNKSIGYKRYCANILCWNKLYGIKKNIEYKYHNIRLLCWQIDYGTFIGMPAILHNKIKKIFYLNRNEEDLFDNNNNNPLYKLSNFWFCSKYFLYNNIDITEKYKIDENINNDMIENIYSNYDFYYFLLLHIDSIINNFNIINFTALNIHPYDNNTLLSDDECYKYSGLPNVNSKITQIKPKNKINYNNVYTNLTKGHYDKCYIIDLTLTYIYISKNKIPITYNKNYTSFGEDLLYTNMLFRINEIFIPHPFLAISKCNNNKTNNKTKKNKTNNKINTYEIIYTLLPFDNIGNLKLFELYKWLNPNKDKGTVFVKQDKNIDKFKNNIEKIKGGYDCNIKYKLDTTIYTTKLKIVRNIFNCLKNFTKLYYKFDYVINNEPNMIIIVDKNINNFHNLEKKINDYNNKFNFENTNYIVKILNPLKKISSFTYSNNMTNFVKKYILSNGNCYDEICNKKNDEINYKSKYLKYKQKYINLKKSLQ